MRHGKKVHKLERPKAHRHALMSNLASALITHGKIKTTEAKAKALKPLIDKLITTAKLNTVHARRLVGKTIKSRDLIKKLFDESAPEMLNRTSGYSRIMRIGARRGDSAPVVMVELIQAVQEQDEKTKKGRKGWRKFASKPKAKAEKRAAGLEATSPAGEEEEAETTAIDDEETVAAEEAPAEQTQEASDEMSAEEKDEEPESDLKAPE
jgi:large subunit ribosomal protein L17